jgi:hypothetical protein
MKEEAEAPGWIFIHPLESAGYSSELFALEEFTLS